MKKTIGLLIAFTIILTTAGCKDANLKEGSNNLVTFNDSSLNIKTEDLYNELKEKYGINILLDLIDAKLLNKEYKDTEEMKTYVDVQVSSIKNYYETDEEFLNYIKSYGYESEDELREYFKLNYKRNLIVEKYVNNSITENDINSYYENKITGDITGSHILIESTATDSMTEDEQRKAKEEALNKAKEAIQKIKDGTSFADVAKEYSDDDSNYDNGGKMGTFNTLELDDVTRQAFEKLEVGKYSQEVVETEYGYELFYKEKEDTKPKFEDVKSYIVKKMSDEKLTSDNKLQYEALKYFREKYGFKINDEDLEVYYENTMKNLMNSD